MATDATGTPTSLGIPKYNTSGDAPSGLGFNAAMDVIDELIAARIEKPSSPSTGDVLTFNGTAWVAANPGTLAVGAWQSYTPTVGAVGGSPTLGNGTVVARYVQIGKLVAYIGTITLGSTTNLGEIATLITLPVAAASGMASQIVGGARLHDVGTTYHFAQAEIPGGLAHLLFRTEGVTVHHSAPFSWTANDTLQWHVVYEAA